MWKKCNLPWIGITGGNFMHGNEIFGFIKERNFRNNRLFTYFVGFPVKEFGMPTYFCRPFSVQLLSKSMCKALTHYFDYNEIMIGLNNVVYVLLCQVA
jgi:hypothetical protein